MNECCKWIFNATTVETLQFCNFILQTLSWEVVIDFKYFWNWNINDFNLGYFYVCYNLISISKLKYKEYKLSNSRWFIGYLTHCKFFKNADCRYFYNRCHILLWMWILAYWINGFFHTFQRTPRQDILLNGRRTSEYSVSFENSLGNHQPYITMFWKHLTKHHKALFCVMNVCFSI